MSTKTVTKKRKSADGNAQDAKRTKIVKSAERPAPMKSALKRPESAESTSTKPVMEEKKRRVSKSTNIKSRGGDGAGTVTTKESEDVEEDKNGIDLTPDQTADLLAGFSSSDEEDEDEAGVPISSLPRAPSAGLIKKRINQAISEQDDPETTPGVIYIGRVPHGFFEPQMRAYFSQFGDILKLRLGRNRKTGKSQHHAFVEFASAAVADIVVKTMDKYLLFGHLLQVRRVPREQVKDNMFKDAGMRKKPAPRNKLEGGKLKRGATRDVWESRVEQEKKRRARKAEQLKEMGYEFDMPDVKEVADVRIKPKMDVVEAEIVEQQRLLESGEPVVEKAIEAVVEGEQEAAGEMVKEITTSKKRAASGKPQTKRVEKKIKT